jgi:amino acid transporter
MGRDGVLPRAAFGRLNGQGTPIFNMLLIGAVTLVGSLLINYEHAAELLNFGAFIAFMGVNLAAVRTFYRRGSIASLWSDVAAPTAGFLFCAVIWISLPLLAKELGTAWLIVGLVYLTTLTRGFSRAPVQLDFSE